MSKRSRPPIGPRLLQPGSSADPLVVVRSDFWHFNAIGFFDGDSACVIDPGIRREDIELLGARLRWQGRDASPRSVETVILTHSHHDHLRGWPHFESADVIQPAVAAFKPPLSRKRILAAKSAVDRRLDEEHTGFSYPPAHGTFESTRTVQVGTCELELRFLPGHSNCTSAVWIPSLRTLCTADYLVSPGLPYCRWDADAFDTALDTLTHWVQQDQIERVWPSHNHPINGQSDILEAIDLDRRVMQTLRARAVDAIDRGLDGQTAIDFMVEDLDAVRGWHAGLQGRQDLDNAQRVLDSLARRPSAGKGQQGDAHGDAAAQHDGANA